jgi:hypothetical protein
MQKQQGRSKEALKKVTMAQLMAVRIYVYREVQQAVSISASGFCNLAVCIC